MNSVQATLEWKYTPYEGVNLANQNGQKLGIFGRMLEGSHSSFYCYFNKYQEKGNNNVQMMCSSLISIGEV